MNDMSFELNIVILFILLFVLTLTVLIACMGDLAGCTTIVLYCVVSILCNFIDYNVISSLRSAIEIKFHPLTVDFNISNKFS